MVKKAVVILLALGAVGRVSAQGRDLLARFEGAIGAIPTSSPFPPVNPDGTFQNVSQNVVRGVVPPGQNWRIADLKASVDFYGRIKVRGRGLLLAGGNNIGRNANQRVFATLICEAAAPFVQHSTAFTGVPIEENGDFRIDDTLDPVPSDCPSPLLLIRSGFSTPTGTGAWFAAGIPKPGDEY